MVSLGGSKLCQKYTLIAARSEIAPAWTFKDGIHVHDELRDVDIERIRAVCSQQSRSGWTSIASRERLYQFIALSDEDTQLEMRQKALSMISMDSYPHTIRYNNFGSVGTLAPKEGGDIGGKR
jgi:hypothetical protein